MSERIAADPKRGSPAFLDTLMERAGRPEWGLAFLILTLLAFCLLITLPETRHVRLNDFPAYYGAGKVVAEGHPELLYGSQFKWFTNLPITSLLFTPLSLLRYDAAWRLFWWLQVVSYFATCALVLACIRRYFAPLSPAKVVLAALVFASFAPVLRRCLVLGQTTPMLVLLFALIYWLIRAGWLRVAGSLLGLLCLIKIPPMLLLPLLLARRRFAVAGPAFGVLIGGILLSWLIFGTELHAQYADRVIWDNFGRSEAAFNNQSLDGAFMRAFTERGLADWTTIPRPASVAWGGALCALALFALLAWTGSRLLFPASPPRDDAHDTGSLELEIALGVSLMVLLFPVVWIHYYLFLMVPLGVLPAWWNARSLPAPIPVGVVLILGTFLASGFQSLENADYAARESETAFRWLQNRQPIGALLLVIGLAFPWLQIARRTPPRS